MLCDTCWLAVFQRRVEKDRSSREERKSCRERERVGKKKRATYKKKSIKNKELLYKITLRQRQKAIWHQIKPDLKKKHVKRLFGEVNQ